MPRFVRRVSPWRLGWLVVPAGLASSCLGLAEVEDPATKDGGAADAMGVDGGGFPGFGGAGGDANAAGGGADSSVGGSAGSAPTGGGGAPPGGGGTGGTPPGGTLTLPVLADGFLANPDLCGKSVWDSYSQPSYKAIHVGRDVPCSGIATYRAFMRFDVKPASGVTPKSAKLRFHFTSTTDPISGVKLVAIPDYAALDAGDWSAAELKGYGTVLGPATPLGWVEVDVLDSLLQALGSGSKLAFKLQYENEGEDPADKSRWYGITAQEQGNSNVAQVVVDY